MRRLTVPGRAVALAGVLPAVLHLAVTLGYDSSYSKQLYTRHFFLGLYDRGIYRYRVLGRELVLQVGRVLDHFDLRVYTPATDMGHGRPAGDLFTALVVVNGVAFVALAVVLYRTTVRSDADVTAYVVLIVVVALSGYVVTPYDYLSYVFIVAGLAAALRARPWSWAACLVLAVAGTATRESFLIAAAAAVGALVATGGWRALFSPGDRLWRAAAALGVGSVGTYIALRVALADPSQPDTSIFTAVPRSVNWRMGSLIALGLYLLGAWAVHATAPRLSGPARRWWLTARVVLWVAGLPYLVACVRGGLWFEAMRLLMPFLLCEHVLRARAAP